MAKRGNSIIKGIEISDDITDFVESMKKYM